MIVESSMLMTAFTLGLLGSGHCVAMCGGIAGALGMRACGPGQIAAVPALGLYTAGRLFSYSALGAIGGTLGALATDFVPAASLALRGLAGVVLVAMGAYLLGWRQAMVVFERAGARLFGTLRARLAGASGPAEPFATGVAWGLLPCGLVYGTLSWSLASGSAAGGALLMCAFGLGTVPAVLGASMLGAPFAELLRTQALRRLAGVLVIAFGIWTLSWGGMVFAHAHAGQTDDAAHQGVHDARGTHGQQGPAAPETPFSTHAAQVPGLSEAPPLDCRGGQAPPARGEH